ncbi:MarR family winged helix-turn-helix transcriptional regulator [Peterkaempfera griseoplana]|uniref:MarR family winged helix-turn-helix transcriptional regulator n=1 Tax=Peterkaempfera griseoplana TaxID=66896 RepID=UPI000D150AB4|nr:MarR family transcriptional regulator [Peterkaempfera griseoplana]
MAPTIRRTADDAPAATATAAVDPAHSAAAGDAGPSQGPQEQGDAAELSDALMRAMKRMRRQTSLRLEPYGITPGQGRALRVLAHAVNCETPGRAMRLSELADRLHIAPRSATTVVDALEAAGMVVRVPDPADRRAVGLHLTDAGRRAVQRIGLVRQEVAEEYFADVSAEEREVVLRVLRQAENSYGARTPCDERGRRRQGGA